MTVPMTDPPRLERVSHDTYHDVKLRLREYIKACAQAATYRLPAEAQLSEMLAVSRPTVRSALLSLQKEGLLKRSHGRGTFINRYAVEMGTNLAEDKAFVDIIRDLGHEPSVEVLGRGLRPAPPVVTEKLGLGEDDEVVVIERLFRSSGSPAVYSVDYVPRHDVTDVDAPSEISTFDFIAMHTTRDVAYSIADIYPVAADAAVASRLGLAEGAPVLRLLHTHIDDDDRPAAATSAFVNPELLTFSVVRTYHDV